MAGHINQPMAFGLNGIFAWGWRTFCLKNGTLTHYLQDSSLVLCPSDQENTSFRKQIRAHIHMYVDINVHTYTYHTHKHKHMHINTYKYVHIHTYMHTHSNTCALTYLYPHYHSKISACLSFYKSHFLSTNTALVLF